MSTQSRRVSSETPEPDLQIAPRRERLKSTVHHSGPILLAGGFGILVLLIFALAVGYVLVVMFFVLEARKHAGKSDGQ